MSRSTATGAKGQHVSVGDVLASIVPAGGTEIIGRMEVPSAGFGKVREGQAVNVKLNGFPYMEYGILKGRIRSISSACRPGRRGSGVRRPPIRSRSHSRRAHDDDLRKELPMIQQMDGTGEIVTEDMRLIEQFVQPILSLFRNH